MAQSTIDQLYEYLSTVKRPWLFLVSVFGIFVVISAIVLSAVWFITRRSCFTVMPAADVVLKTLDILSVVVDEQTILLDARPVL